MNLSCVGGFPYYQAFNTTMCNRIMLREIRQSKNTYSGYPHYKNMITEQYLVHFAHKNYIIFY